MVKHCGQDGSDYVGVERTKAGVTNLFAWCLGYCYSATSVRAVEQRPSGH